MTRHEQRAEFPYKLGLLLRPVLDVIERPHEFNTDERRRIRGRFEKDRQQLHNQLSEFCMAEPGTMYQKEWAEIAARLSTLASTIDGIVDLPSWLPAELENQRAALLSAIASVPVQTDSTIYLARTPFTSYLRLKALCDAADKHVICIDRYIDYTLFHRQLAGIPSHVEITLVTWRSALSHDFIDVSRLFAAERGTKYRLCTNQNFHDRWLRRDNQMFLLGGSIKHAGTKNVYTVAPMASTAAELQQVDQLIATSQEVFGPRQTSHP